MLLLLQKTKSLFFRWKLHHLVFFLEKPMRTFSNLIRLSKWINDHRDIAFSDFYNPKRDSNNRYKLYQYLIDREQLYSSVFCYLEFGVAGGESFRWWVQNTNHEDTRYFGFDTFTGLPEDWGHFKAGDMSAGNHQPTIKNDARHEFLQGLFQQTIPGFILKNRALLTGKLVIHMDADLFSSTLYVLTSMAPYLKDGDIIIFDEFNVPNHEFLAFESFVSGYYLDYEVIGAVNNYYNLALKIKKGINSYNHPNELN